MNNKKKHLGSSFESFLQKEGIFEEVNAAAVKSVIAQSLKQHMEEQRITQTEMAKKLQTSRTGLQRLLDPNNYSITLLTLGRAATVLGKQVHINLVSSSESFMKKVSKK